MWAKRGIGAPPVWVPTLLMAEEWGMSPWIVEARLSALWADRWMALREARQPAKQLKKPN